MTGGHPDHTATVAATGDISDALMNKSVWNDNDMIGHGIPMVDVEFTSIGGGMGSFAMVDTLRIAGVDPSRMVVLGDNDHPHQTYEHLATNSQIPHHERIRSDSSSVMDCIWGWPGYALREAVEKKEPTWAMQVLVEPVFANFYTPQASQVYKSIDREVPRIGWNSMLRHGTVRTIRRRDGGDYFVLFTPEAGTSRPGEWHSAPASSTLRSATRACDSPPIWPPTATSTRTTSGSSTPTNHIWECTKNACVDPARS